VATPHDALFAFTFGQPDHAAALLRSALPPALATAIEWGSLTRCDTKLGDGLRDGLAAGLLYTADLAGRPAFLYIVLEHKPGDDPLTAFQLLRYVVRIWERHRQDQPASRRLPPVLPFVLHHGEAPWQSARSLRALVDVGGLPRPLAATTLRHQPEATFVLDDLATQSEDELHARVDALMPKLALL
jgi:predicted transposase YdaD